MLPDILKLFLKKFLVHALDERDDAVILMDERDDTIIFKGVVEWLSICFSYKNESTLIHYNHETHCR